MIGYIFYVVYFLLFLSVLTPFIYSGKYTHYSLLPLCFFPHFNATAFLKIGLTISFFELYLFTFVLLILCTHFKQKPLINNIDKIFILFIIISFISIIIAQLRIYIFQDLIPSSAFEELPLIRSLKSLNRLFVYPIMLLYVREFLIYKEVDIAFYFKKYLAYSGILPSLAVLLQIFKINFILLFNNPSFAANLGWVPVGRPLGLTNEASFYAFMVLFSFIGVYYSQKEKIISNKIAIILYSFYFIAVLASISRTGMLVFLLFIIAKNYNKLSLKKIILVIIAIGIISNITIYGFNLTDRFLSSFDTQADLSTIERYGSTEAILTLTLNQGLLWGVGIYNYMYYLHPYIPYYLLNAIDYAKNDAIPSFNLILQLWGEWGTPLFLIFFLFTYRWLKKIKQDPIVKDWFIYLGVFALSFQILNFSLPFIILLYPLSHENIICNRPT